METPETRKVRLAQALRDNLRRRKAQARDVAAATRPEAPSNQAPGATPQD